MLVRNPLDTIGPELEILIRGVIWKYSILTSSHASVGQTLLGIKYSNSSTKKLYILAAVDLLLQYCLKRQSFLINKLPGSEDRKFSLVKWFSILSSIESFKLLNI